MASVFRRLWADDASDYGNDHSRADIGSCLETGFERPANSVAVCWRGAGCRQRYTPAVPRGVAERPDS